MRLNPWAVLVIAATTGAGASATAALLIEPSLSQCEATRDGGGVCDQVARARNGIAFLGATFALLIVGGLGALAVSPEPARRSAVELFD